MVVALVSVVVLLLSIWVAHVVMDLVNARRDYQFYSEVVRIRDAVRRSEAQPAPQREDAL